MAASRVTRRPDGRRALSSPAASAPKTIAVLEAAVALSDSEGVSCLSPRTLGRQLRCSTLEVLSAVRALERAGSLIRLAPGVHALAGTPAASREEDPEGAAMPGRAAAHASFLLDLRSPPW